MACNHDSNISQLQESRRQFYFLGKHMRRTCFESLLAISSHKLDHLGAMDKRYADTRAPSKPSRLAASFDAFAMVLYNSVAEPLPDRSFDGINMFVVFVD